MNTNIPTIEKFDLVRKTVAGMKSWALVHIPTGRMVAGSTEKQTREQLYNSWANTQTGGK